MEQKQEHPWPSGSSYVKPHPWDNWSFGSKTPDNNPRNRLLPKPHQGFITLKNAFGQSIQTEPSRKHTKKDWQPKFFTTDCRECPLHVPLQEARPLLQTLHPILKGRPQGLCMFGASGQRRILILDFSKLAPCAITKDEVKQRLDDKKKTGNFFVANQ